MVSLWHLHAYCVLVHLFLSSSFTPFAARWSLFPTSPAAPSALRSHVFIILLLLLDLFSHGSSPNFVTPTPHISPHIQI